MNSRRALLKSLLGRSWREERPLPHVLSARMGEGPNDLREDLVLDLGAGEGAPAIFTRPRAGAPPFPAVLYCHAHGNRYDTGCVELVEGRPALQSPPWAEALAGIGVAALSLDMPCFGGRRAAGESALAKAHLWRGGTLFGAMLADLAGGLDYLASRPDIAADRIAAMGLSMGATHAFWLGALDDRVKAVAQLCVFADLATLVDRGEHDRHGNYMTVPGLFEHFTTGEIAGLVAPRPQFVGIGLADPLTPGAAFAVAEGDLRAAYRGAEAESRLTLLVDPAASHRETPAMRREVLAFLARSV